MCVVRFLVKQCVWQGRRKNMCLKSFFDREDVNDSEQGIVPFIKALMSVVSATAEHRQHSRIDAKSMPFTRPPMSEHNPACRGRGKG